MRFFEYFWLKNYNRTGCRHQSLSTDKTAGNFRIYAHYQIIHFCVPVAAEFKLLCVSQKHFCVPVAAELKLLCVSQKHFFVPVAAELKLLCVSQKHFFLPILSQEYLHLVLLVNKTKKYFIFVTILCKMQQQILKIVHTHLTTFIHHTISLYIAVIVYRKRYTCTYINNRKHNSLYHISLLWIHTLYNVFNGITYTCENITDICTHLVINISLK